MKIEERNGEVVLEGDDIDMKIDTNRNVYVKKKEDTQFKSIDVQLDYGYTIEEKSLYLKNFYQMLIE